MLTGQAGLKETLSTEYLAVSGSRLDPLSFLMLLNQPKGNFDTVAP